MEKVKYPNQEFMSMSVTENERARELRVLLRDSLSWPRWYRIKAEGAALLTMNLAVISPQRLTRSQGATGGYALTWVWCSNVLI